jgi:hypothetical protein
MLKAVAIVPLLVLAACGVVSLPDSRPDLARTWDRATVVLPAIGGRPIRFARIDDGEVGGEVGGRRLPTVIYLHGCTGLGDRDFLRRLAAAGFAVIAPDSFARSYRPLQCDPKNKSGGYNLFIYEFRLAELAFALQRAAELEWVDRRNLFLIGSSEGGVAAALYRGGEFNARVIAQWTCHGAPIVRGLGAPEGEPVLAIVHQGDPWYRPERTRGQGGDCGQFMGDRPASRSIVLSGSGGHNVFTEPGNVATVVTFLSRHRRP